MSFDNTQPLRLSANALTALVASRVVETDTALSSGSPAHIVVTPSFRWVGVATYDYLRTFHPRGKPEHLRFTEEFTVCDPYYFRTPVAVVRTIPAAVRTVRFQDVRDKQTLLVPTLHFAVNFYTDGECNNSSHIDDFLDIARFKFSMLELIYYGYNNTRKASVDSMLGRAQLCMGNTPAWQMLRAAPLKYEDLIAATDVMIQDFFDSSFTHCYPFALLAWRKLTERYLEANTAEEKEWLEQLAMACACRWYSADAHIELIKLAKGGKPGDPIP